jgi:uncharacterized coiled-coil DUF342 family protein
MSSEWELDEGIKSIKSAWRREHTARCNLEKILENVEPENAKLKEENAALREERDTYRTQLADVTESTGRVEERCAKLRAERDEWHRVAVSKQDTIDHMRNAMAENAKLLELVNSYADLFEKEAAKNNGRGPYYSGEDWLAMANDMRVELAKCCGELGNEAE